MIRAGTRTMAGLSRDELGQAGPGRTCWILVPPSGDPQMLLKHYIFLLKQHISKQEINLRCGAIKSRWGEEPGETEAGPDPGHGQAEPRRAVAAWPRADLLDFGASVRPPPKCTQSCL